MILAMIHILCRFIGIHRHEWGKWEDAGYYVNPNYVRRGLQERRCLSCGISATRRAGVMGKP